MIIFNPNASVDKLIPLSLHFIYDVTCLVDSMVAVSFSEAKEIKLVNIVSGIVSQTIGTDYVLDGITQRQGKMICCACEHGIFLHDPNGITSTTIVKGGITRLNYVTTFKDNIYHTNCETDTVRCYETSGEKVWEYRDTNILKKTVWCNC